MRYVGRITGWNDDKGFGFVTPNGGGDRAFVHIKAFERAPMRPADGMLISYELLKDDRGRLNVTGARYVVHKSKVETAARSAWPRKAVGALFLTVLAIGWQLSKIPSTVAIAYGAMSICAFLLYGIDKSAAVHNQWRTKESTLHLVGLVGGWPGALFAQDVFRHKLQKAEFQSVFWSTVVVNCAGLASLLATDKAVAINQAILDIVAG